MGGRDSREREGKIKGRGRREGFHIICTGGGGKIWREEEREERKNERQLKGGDGYGRSKLST